MINNFIVTMCYYLVYIFTTYILYYLLVVMLIDLYRAIKSVFLNQLANSNVSYRARFWILVHTAKWQVYESIQALLALNLHVKGRRSFWNAPFNRLLQRKIKH